jgi:hypothetical protein
MMHTCRILLSGLIFMASPVIAQQRLDMQGTSIIGNKELPNILTIVPWKSAEPVSLSTPSFDSVLDETPRTLERSTFQRQLDLFTTIYTEKKP